jgi:hypothetical protein
MKYQNQLKVLKKEIKLSVTSNLFTRLRKGALYISIAIMVMMLQVVEVEHDTE